MQITGQIVAGGDVEFSRDAWCRHIASRPEFHERPPATVPNPFKPGEMMPTPVHEDLADVVLNGRKVGSVWWSMNEEPLVNVDVDESALRFVHQWAEALGGVFVEQES
jgi:hypothetical protein